MDINEAVNRLYSLQKFGIKMGLSNIQALLEYLGNPHEKYKSFHIAGTNGKGSTSSFLSSILMEHGYKTGLYTSPHFIRFNERVRINGEMIPDDFITDFVSGLSSYMEEHKPTFFEVTTALAFKYFADKEIDFAVVETGLGGRLDATNVLKPLASVITSISLEHTDLLGCSIKEIAGEKGGIIKENSMVFLGMLPFDAENVLIDISSSLKSKVFRIQDFVRRQGHSIDFISPVLSFKDIRTPLKGNYQKLNASLAVLAFTETLGLKDKLLVKKGIDNVVPNSGIQGRFEIYNESPKVIFDSAHNPEGINTFLTAFEEEAGKYEKKILLFGVMKDKAIEQMLQSLKPYFDEIHFNSIDYERAASVEELNLIAAKLNTVYKAEANGAEFIREFIKGNSKDCLVVLGSMYVLGQIKKDLLTKKKLDIFYQ